MLKLIAAAVLLVGWQEKNEGLEALSKMEKKVVETKSLKVHIVAKGAEKKANGTVDDEGGTVTLSLGSDNRARLVRTTTRNKEEDVLFVCDGTVLKYGGTRQAPKEFRNWTALTVARTGVIGSMGDFAPDRKDDVDPATVFTVADAKLGAAEKVGEEEATTVTYVLKIKDKPFLMKVKVWISKKTDLPLRRTIHVSMPDDPEEKDHTLEFDESYSIVTDAKFDEEHFKVK